jgi:general secretion pathway protein G
MIYRTELKRQQRAAFTLMEMLVVVAIIVALAGIGGFFLLGALGSSQKDIALTQVKGPLSNACKSYYLKHQKFPDSLAVLLQKDEFGILYLDDPNAINDPWGRPYQYNAAGTENGGRQPDISCDPPDGSPRIGNWPKRTN